MHSSTQLAEVPTKLAWAPDELGAILAVGMQHGGVRVLRAGPGGGWRGGGALPTGRSCVRCARWRRVAICMFCTWRTRSSLP